MSGIGKAVCLDISRRAAFGFFDLYFLGFFLFAQKHSTLVWSAGEYSSGGEPFDIDFRGVALAGTLDQAELLISAVQLY